MNKLLGSIVMIVLLQACNTLDFFEKTASFSQHEWKSNEKLPFLFTIEDTVSAYNIYVVIRHEDAYRYNNIWLNVITQSPGDTVRTQLVNVKLADNANGWLGTGMDDIFDHRVRITLSPIRLKKGNYTFVLQQAMREDPLQHIFNAGIRIEKAKL